jgi:hypothetical protein
LNHAGLQAFSLFFCNDFRWNQIGTKNSLKIMCQRLVLDSIRHSVNIDAGSEARDKVLTISSSSDPLSYFSYQHIENLDMHFGADCQLQAHLHCISASQQLEELDEDLTKCQSRK